MTHKNCKIFCADTMIVGRWYKLVTYPKGTYNSSDYAGPPYRYTVNYSCSDTNVTLLYDSVYIKSAGEFTISVVDMYGNTDSKTIYAIKEPKINRTFYTIVPTDWDDFKEKADECGTYAYIRVPKGEYSFDFTETPYDVKEGTIIDFLYSTVSLTTSVTAPAGFRFLGDYSGIRNCTFVGVNMYGNDDIQKNTSILQFGNGYNIRCENIQFNKTYGYNIMCGIWPSWNNGNISGTRHYGEWAENKYANCDRINGYIDDDGTVNTDTTEFWTHSNLVNIRESIDNSFRVGRINLSMPTSARMFDIAFYDENGDVLEVMRDLQYYRKYYYPEGSTYVRFSVCQTSKPGLSGDPSEVMRMMAGTKYTDLIPVGVEDIWFDNISAIDHVSGIISIVGVTQDAHFNRFATLQSGWGAHNHWGWDAEDGFASMIGLVISHSYIRSLVAFMSSQGNSVISSVTATIQVTGSAHATSVINCVLHNIDGKNIRCYYTTLNSYYWRLANDDDPDGSYFIFGCMETMNNAQNRAAADNIRSIGNTYVLGGVT